jgi:uncharacterized protein (DUF2147 family)
MSQWKRVFVMTLVLFYLPVVMGQITPEGDWITIDDATGEKRAVIRFVIHDNTMTGTVVDVYPKPGDTGICSLCPGKFKDNPIRGMQIVWGLKEKKQGVWDDGRILDAKTGQIYHVTMSLNGNKLLVRGYIGIPLLGRTQVWERS